MMRQRLLLPLLVVVLVMVGLIQWRLTTLQADVQPGYETIQSSASAPPRTHPAYLTSEQIPVLTLEQILSSEPSVQLAQLDPEKLWTMVVTGDVIPARGVDAKIRQLGASYPFAGPGIAELLQSGDLTIVDLEAPLLADCPIHNEGFTFCGQAGFAQAMADAGVDIATLENNHIGNYGQSGISETIEHLSAAHIDYATSSRLSVASVGGLRVGILAFTGVGGRFYPDSITAAIKAARPQVDLLLAAFHWGKEYELTPKADPNIAPDDPRVIAQLTIDAGADFIIGNHPHWVQGVELINHKLVNYAYGNFIFDQSWSTETTQGYIGTYTFYGSKLVKVAMQPVIIKSQSQPNIPPSETARLILQRIKDSSQAMANNPLN